MRSTLRPEPMLTPAEVGALFGVSAGTVTAWANAGRLRSSKTLGGHRRFRESDVRELLELDDPEVAALADVRAILGEES